MNAHTKDGNQVRIEQVISVALVGNKSFMVEKAVHAGVGNPIDILHITGFANEQLLVPSKTPESRRPTHYIKGAFDGVNMLTGEHYISGQLILPDSAAGFIGALLDKNSKGFNIDLIISLERAEKSIVGYKFGVRLLNMNDVLTLANGSETPNTTPDAAETINSLDANIEDALTEPPRKNRQPKSVS